MLVAVREFRPEEVRRAFGGSPRVRYTISSSGDEVTVTDVMDPRARQVFKCDVYAQSNENIFETVGRPIALAVLPPFASPEAVVVVDGTELVRDCTLLEPGGGLVAQCCRLFMSMALKADGVSLDAISLAALEFSDNDVLKDLILGVPLEETKGSGVAPADLCGDTSVGDIFSSFRDASFCDIKDECDLNAALGCLRGSTSPGCNQVLGLALRYRGCSRLNSTMLWFVSLSAPESMRNICSTRHCIVTAAQLLQCRAPHEMRITTALSSLVEPALLGRRPGLWVSCFAPSTPSGAKHPETFKESFRIAATAFHVYAARRGIGNSCSMHLLKEHTGERRKHAVCYVSSVHGDGRNWRRGKCDNFVFYTPQAEASEKQARHFARKLEEVGAAGRDCFLSERVKHNEVGPAAAEAVHGGNCKCCGHWAGSSPYSHQHRGHTYPSADTLGALWFRLFVHLQKELDRYARREHIYRRCVAGLKKALTSRIAVPPEATDKSLLSGRDSAAQRMEDGARKAVGQTMASHRHHMRQLREEFHEIQKADGKMERTLETLLRELGEERRRRAATEEKMHHVLSLLDSKNVKDKTETLMSLLQEKCETLRHQEPHEDRPSKVGAACVSSESATPRNDCISNVKKPLLSAGSKSRWVMSPSCGSSSSSAVLSAGSHRRSRGAPVS